MSDDCEFLEHRTRAVDRRNGDDGEGDNGHDDGDDGQGDGGVEFDHERPYCTAVDAFVQPMRADICAKRYGLDPESDCEFYREAKGLGSITGFDGTESARSKSDEVDS